MSCSIEFICVFFYLLFCSVYVIYVNGILVKFFFWDVVMQYLRYIEVCECYFFEFFYVIFGVIIVWIFVVILIVVGVYDYVSEFG